MSIASTIQKITAALARTTKGLADELATMRARIVELRGQVQYTERAPLPVQEVVAEIIPGVVSEAGGYWLREQGGTLFNGDRSLANPSATGSREIPWNLRAGPRGALCAADPAAARRLLEGLMKNVQYEAGPASGERPALLAKLRAELVELEAAEEQFVDEAAAAGVTIEHRTEVVQRRNAEAEHVRRVDRAAEERREVEEAVNRQQSAGRILAPSRYLETGRLDG